MIQSCDHGLVEVPAVITGEIESIAALDAFVTGSIIDIGEGVSDHGHCYSTSPGPTLNGSHTSFGAANHIKNYLSELENLTPGTNYYVRAFLISGSQTYYGDEIIVRTLNGNVEITTNEIFDEGINHAQCRSTVTSDGGFDLKGRGILWSREAMVTLDSYSGILVSNLTGGEQVDQLENLSPNTEYFARAYAFTENDSSYGEILNFSTKDGIIVFDISKVLDKSETTINCIVTIIDDGGSPITSRGICWSRSLYPTVYGNKIISGEGSGEFSIEITDLEPGTLYNIRFFAENAIGIEYSNQISEMTVSSK